MVAPSLEVEELEELPEQWRMSKLALLLSKWLRQEDTTYAVVHGMRIGEYEAAFRVYQQLMIRQHGYRQHWYRFDFALATKLAESLDEDCLDKACRLYNGMIQPGGYQPHLNLHNSLFRALISKPGSSSKHYLKQAELIFHNLMTSALEIHMDIYVGLIWIHSYQGTVDKERIASLREEMRQVGIKEAKEVLVYPKSSLKGRGRGRSRKNMSQTI
ncbi:hypothetical protein QYF36_017370 [Acer negundo]|nr:hypothetical protein QYF36_017370 [Acer negundo]